VDVLGDLVTHRDFATTVYRVTPEKFATAELSLNLIKNLSMTQHIFMKFECEKHSELVLNILCVT